MPRKPGSNDELTEGRLEKIETMVASSVPVASIIASQSREWSLTPRQVRNLLRKVDERAAQQRSDDAPFVRERLLRRAERLTAKCIADKKHGAAVQSMGVELKLTAALEQTDAEVERLLLDIGAPPKDPAESHIWLQRVMHINIFGLMRSKSIDLLTKMHLFGDWSAKAGLMGDKAIVQEDLRQLKEADRADREAPNAEVDKGSTRRIET